MYARDLLIAPPIDLVWMRRCRNLIGRVCATFRTRHPEFSRPVLTLLELQSRFGDKPLKFHVICTQLSPKRDCSAKSLPACLPACVSFLLCYTCVSYFCFCFRECFIQHLHQFMNIIYSGEQVPYQHYYFFLFFLFLFFSLFYRMCMACLLYPA